MEVDLRPTIPFPRRRSYKTGLKERSGKAPKKFLGKREGTQLISAFFRKITAWSEKVGSR